MNVGLTTSPHISCLRERIQINGNLISESDFCDIYEYVAKIEDEYNIKSSFFEMITVITFEYFKEMNIDVGIIEVGLGGTYDATNIIEKPLLSVLTSISLDHTKILGDTVELITRDKCGIIKKDRPVVIGPTVPFDIVNEYAIKMNSNVYRVDGDGNYDNENNLVVRKCLEVLRDNGCELMRNVKDSNVEYGLQQKPMCRFEKRIVNIEGSNDAICIMDAAHNEMGMKKFFEYLRDEYPMDRYEYKVVMGMSYGKDVTKCLNTVYQYSNDVNFVNVTDNERSIPVKEITKIWNNIVDIKDKKITHNDTIDTVMHKCLQDIQTSDKECILVICGSLYIMSSVRKAIGIHEPCDDIDMSSIEFIKLPRI